MTTQPLVHVTKEFRFDAAHILPLHEGKCATLHGHTYKLVVEVVGEISPKTGMAIDFGLITDLVKNEIVDKWDHHFLLPTHNSDSYIFNLASTGGIVRVKSNAYAEELVIPKAMCSYVAEEQSTAECLAHDAYNIIVGKIEDMELWDNVRLFAVEVWETPTSFARYEGD